MYRRLGKRVFDIGFSMLALGLLLPFLILIAVLIKLTSRGPVFYVQERIGKDAVPFPFIKFRTMVVGAEQQGAGILALRDDPRVTIAGRMLRRFSLDELPQLWNVLRGDMSLVGPRPERPEFTREFRKEHIGYDIRHTVRPGITGYAQIHGWRGYTSLEERLRHDIYYIRNWSLALDAYVLAMTLVRGWSEKTRNGL
jgi:exopolysaccharide biosynthesis polyprenyl glycosylphosphotransferase